MENDRQREPEIDALARIVKDGFDRMDSGFEEMRAGFAKTEERFKAVDRRLDNFSYKLDQLIITQPLPRLPNRARNPLWIGME
jgi:hypothetical protein